MRDHISSNKQHQIQNSHKNLKNPKNFIIPKT